jgi:UDP-N-acetylmuramate--alanine ligase
LSEFSHAFTDADVVVVTDIYAASEPNDGKITGVQVAEAIASVHGQVHYQPTLKDVQNFLVKNLKSGDLAVFLGAGNLNQAIAPTIEAIEELRSNSSIA